MREENGTVNGWNEERIVSVTYVVGPTIAPVFLPLLLVPHMWSDDCLSRVSLPTFLGRGEEHRRGERVGLKSGCGGKREPLHWWVSQTHDDPSVVHDAAIEPVVRLSAQSRGHLPAAQA